MERCWYLLRDSTVLRIPQSLNSEIPRFRDSIRSPKLTADRLVTVGGNSGAGLVCTFWIIADCHMVVWHDSGTSD